MKRLLYLIGLLILITGDVWLSAQEGFSDKTRALYILDISRYIEFNESFQEQGSFIITLLDRDDKLYWELEGMSRTRKFVQEKPIKILLYSKIDQLGQSNVVFLNKEDNYNIAHVLDKIKGQNTLLISEGYPFRTSMINFVAVDGQTKFEANEELMNSEGLYVNELFLAQAVQTREDWEALYEVTEDELKVEKSITEQQYILIERQLGEISRQEAMIKENQEILASLREEVLEREEDIRKKSIVL
ncbi:MAG: YfiR family protein, partial [Gammaproteobacteria bacterium]|nr:YfiR family protein [Gammaproteobacteria bacterium]